MSCCGRGGSWFGNCGSAGDTTLDHAWHEGLQACKAQSQSKKVVDHQLNGAHHERNESFEGVDNANSKSVITVAQSLAFDSAPIPGALPTSVAPAQVNSSAVLARQTTHLEPVTVTVRAMISTSSSVTTAASKITTIKSSNSTPARVSIHQNDTNTVMPAVVHRNISSRGCEHLLGIILYTCLSVTVVFSQF